MLHPMPPRTAQGLQCPETDCSYNTNTSELEKAQKSELNWESTRSHDGEDAWRDGDGFDLDEELKRLRRAVHEVRTKFRTPGPRHIPWHIDIQKVMDGRETVASLLAFISEAFDNIDNNLIRQGPLPQAWMGSSSVTEAAEKSESYDRR